MSLPIVRIGWFAFFKKLAYLLLYISKIMEKIEIMQISVYRDERYFFFPYKVLGPKHPKSVVSACSCPFFRLDKSAVSILF